MPFPFALWLALAASGTELHASPPLRLLPASQEQAAGSEARPGPAAAQLSFEASCDALRPGVGLVRLQWLPAEGASEAQRIELTAFPEGFRTGRYLVSDPLEARLSEGWLERMEPGVNYFWRVLTRREGGWAASPVGRFEAPTCPVDRWIEPDGE